MRGRAPFPSERPCPGDRAFRAGGRAGRSVRITGEPGRATAWPRPKSLRAQRHVRVDVRHTARGNEARDGGNGREQDRDDRNGQRIPRADLE